MSSMTPSQQAALSARGNVLVVAGAGTGKTHTLVERCCALLLEGDCSLDEILMVTFTEAAAAEMRKRIRDRLTGKISESTDVRQVLEEQLALLDTACISTLHSFCLRMVREHFHDERLRLDPEFVVLTAEQVHLLRNKTLDELLESLYGGESADARAFQQFVAERSGGIEGPVRELIWRLHCYSRSLADPAGWFEKQLAMFAESEPMLWLQCLKIGFLEWREHWIRELKQFSGTSNIAKCLRALSAVEGDSPIEKMGEALKQIQEAHDGNWPVGAIGSVRDRIKEFFLDVAFLASLIPGANDEDPLAQDWEWSRGHMQALLRLTQKFGEAFDEAKRESGGVDFTDLEQFALRLLWGARNGRPTALAQEWQRRLKFVFVDEYQDINEAQDTILRAISREGAQANRFLVGDVKQSIYRFRLADPKIFQAYKKLWSGTASAGQTVPLSDNFRSREALLEFVNSVFGLLMREEVGGVGYDSEAHLRFASRENRQHLGREAEPLPRVEIHLRTKAGSDWAQKDHKEGRTDLLELEEIEKEARLVALQLAKLRRDKLQIWDGETGTFRPVDWRDMVVLLRSPRNKAEVFAREFNRAGVPLHVKRESFYSATEVSDLLSLLQLLDNPMQDLPLLAVLRSPLAGLSVDELAMVRAGHYEDRFWTAVLRFCASGPKFSNGAGEIAASANSKLRKFLKSFDLWRRHARQGALSDCVRRILDETHYESLVLTDERGEERLANVNRLLRLLRQFDPYQRQGLLRFLRFVEAQRDAEAEEESASAAVTNAVRLFSVHQSKGLEFPVVAIADLSKPFNFSDLHADILLDAELGLCPRVAPPKINGRYPSLPYWLARRRQKRELFGEELRLLYVAMTRARERLLLVGSVTTKQFETRWNGEGEAGTIALLHARSYTDWLAVWFARNCEANGHDSGETALCSWRLHDDTSLVDQGGETDGKNITVATRLNEAAAGALRRKLSIGYAFDAATEKAAKTSVSALRRRAMEFLEQEEAADFLKLRTKWAAESKAKQSGAEIGTVHHRFLERVSFERVESVSELRSEAERIFREGGLSQQELEWLDFDSLLQFWHSDFGRRIQANAQRVKRELAFTARFSPAELAEAAPSAEADDAALKDEFVVVQGVVDVAVILPKEIWLLDFKTDEVSLREVEKKARLYEPQLKLYARALEKTYRRPVTECRLHFLSCGATVPVGSKKVSRAAADSAPTQLLFPYLSR
jgi:ATP-dependent helicase/nuclease subunit A